MTLKYKLIFLTLFYVILLLDLNTGEFSGDFESQEVDDYYDSQEIEREPRIIGGISAGSTQFPWTVLIRLSETPNSLRMRRWCAGSVLNQNWIVTAAHCIQNPLNQYTISSGDANVDFPDILEQQDRKPIQKVIHPGFNRRTLENDIGLMKVFPPFGFDNYTQSIPFAHFNFVYNGTGTVVGWGGRNENDPKGPRKLQKGPVQFISNDQCQMVYRNRTDGMDRTIFPTQICATGGTSDVCYGDNGGPLMCARGGIQILCGIISFTRRCARNQPPKIYTRISKYYDWLQVGITW